MVRRTISLGSVVLLVMAAASFAQTLPPEPAPVRVGSVIQPPIKTRDVKPVYPAEALQAHVSGVVVLEATIDPAGAVKEVRVLRSIPLLDAAAQDAVRQWQYTPTMVEGKAVSVIMTVTVNFTQAPSSGPGPGPVPQGPASSPVRASPPEISDAVKRAASVLQTHRSVQYVVASTMELTGEGLSAKVAYETSMAYVSPGKTRIETKAPIGLRFLTISDGEFTWTYEGMSKQYTKMASSPGLTAFLADAETRDLARMLLTGGPELKTTTLQDDAVTVDGRRRPCSVIESRLDKFEVPLAQGTALSDLVMVTCVDKALGLGLKSTVSFKTQIPSMGTAIRIELTQLTTTLTLDEPLADALFVFTPPPGSHEGPVTSPFSGPSLDLTGQDAPEFDVRALDGTAYSLASLKGRPVLLDFWATWCGPCRKGMPAIENIARDYKDRGLVVLGVDVGENRKTVEDFLKATPASYPTILGTESGIAGAFQVRGYPTYVLIGADGKIAGYQVGFDSEAQLRALLAKLKLTAAPAVK